jgi:hypothetical protein
MQEHYQLEHPCDYALRLLAPNGAGELVVVYPTDNIVTGALSFGYSRFQLSGMVRICEGAHEPAGGVLLAWVVDEPSGRILNFAKPTPAADPVLAELYSFVWRTLSGWARAGEKRRKTILLNKIKKRFDERLWINARGLQAVRSYIAERCKAESRQDLYAVTIIDDKAAPAPTQWTDTAVAPVMTEVTVTADDGQPPHVAANANEQAELSARLSVDSVNWAEDRFVERVIRPRQEDTGQGLESDFELRKAIELHAMAAAEAYYKTRWNTVENVSSTKPFDLRCSTDAQELHVEVKGTRSNGTSIILTKNEVEHARRQFPNIELFVLFNIELDERGVPVGGEHRILRQWEIKEDQLVAISYKYSLPPCGDH